MPTATSDGAVGIGAGPSLACNSSGGMPSRMHNWLTVCRRLISNSGIWASVCSKVLRAWYDVQFAGRAAAEAGLGDRQRLSLQLARSPRRTAMRPSRVRICT